MGSRLFKLIAMNLALLLVTTSSAYSFQTYFDAEVSIELCPEYSYGGVVIEVFYRVGDSSELKQAQIISSSFDLPNNLYKPVIRFPSYFGTLPFNVVSLCRSAKGYSPPSNIVSLSNCDKLGLYDSDFDGIKNNEEDTNCDNFFSPGDISNPDNLDSDGDGVADLVERIEGTSATNPGESPRPFISMAATYDPDADGKSNPVVWRPSNGSWYVKNPNGLDTSFIMGQKGDIPFTYQDFNRQSDVGVIRQSNNQLTWYFRGAGFPDNKGSNPVAISFGIFGDNIILGSWEKAGVTNPAVARLFGGAWEFYILLSDRTIRSFKWGGNGDLPKPQDFDGDGILDVAVYRPSNQTTYIRQSSNNQVRTYVFGSGTADFTVRGDYTGDDKDELSFWEPSTGLFTSLNSTNGLNPTLGLTKNPTYYKELQLGQYYFDLSLSYNSNGNKHLYTVINHFLGQRKFYPNNDRNQPLQSIQWGVYGDFQG